MSIQDFIDRVGSEPTSVIVVFAAIPGFAWLLGRVHGRRNGGLGAWRYAYSAVVYASCIPGIFSGVLTAYALFFTRTNLVEVNALVYLLPPVSMVVTLGLIRRSVPFDQIPGFDRISGLMVLIAVSFGIALAVSRTRIWLVFGGSIYALFGIAAFAFALLKWGAGAAFRPRGEAGAPLPKFKDHAGTR